MYYISLNFVRLPINISGTIQYNSKCQRERKNPETNQKQPNNRRTNNMENRHYFRPTVNKVYTNKNGSQYRCLSADGFNAEMMNTESKWRFKALGCQMYDDGKIEWNWSIGGDEERE